MKKLNTIFDLLLFPFIIFVRYFSFYQRLNTHSKKTHTKTRGHSFKFFFIIPLLSSLMITQGVADIEPNDDCNNSENLTISSGINIFEGTIETDDVDFYQVTIPASGSITITWESELANKVADLVVGWAGEECNGTVIYDEANLSTHNTDSITVSQDDTIFIKIYNGENKDYTLTIYLDVDISGLEEDDYEKPTFCYEYSYQQGTTLLEETEAEEGPPYIDDDVTIGTDVDISLYIENLGYIGDTNNSYLNAENVVVDIIDINATEEAIYSGGTTYLKKPGRFYRDYIPDTELTVSDAYIKGIDVGDVGTFESFTVDFSITPEEEELDFPLNAKIAYDLAVPIGNTYVMIPQEIYLQSIPMCESNDEGYTPAYSIFNVEHNALTSDDDPIYNLPTQTAMRVDDLQVASYKVDAIHTRNPVSTVVSIELIDASKYGDVVASCSQEDSAISPRVTVFMAELDTNVTHVPFDIQDAIDGGYISDQIYNPGGDVMTSASEFYSVARENAAFRIIYNTLGDGELIQIEEGNNGLYAISNFPTLHQEYPYCKQPVKNPNNDSMTDLTPVACSDTGGNSTPADIAICMECIYGYNTRYLCSRDNFAIRPESFRVSLSDQDQNAPASAPKSHIKTNLDNDQIKIVAGYNYSLEVNATNYLNDNKTLGYDTQFTEDNATEDKHFSFVWSENASIDPYCNDTRDYNKTMTFKNGLLVNPVGALDSNLSNAQIGPYKLEIVDNIWTRYDYEDELLTHHSVHPVHGDVSDYFISGDDCVPNITTVPPENLPIGTIVESGNTGIINVSGCDIKSDHLRYDGTTEYTDINTMIYPYKFDQSAVIPNIGPYSRTNGQTFVYINTPPTLDANNSNMSYNMNGTFFAAGYTDIGSLSNFVTGCYAEDVNMTLTFTYNSPEPDPDKTRFLSYSLKDSNTTGIIRPIPVPGSDDFEVNTHTDNSIPFTIDQNSTFFSKDMEGAITMDLGYNFKRDYNKTLNPRYIEFHDFNITYVSYPNPTEIYADLTDDHKIFGDKELDHNVTFVYGRAKPSQDFYDDVTADSILTPISIVFFCDQDPITCSAVYNIETVLSKTDEFDWYLSRGHVMTDNDGNITLEASTGASVTSPVVINDSGGVNNPDVNVSAGVATRPLEVNIDFGAATNRWLIYNKDNNTTPIPFYRVRFIGQNDWAGHGDTGHVVDSATSYKKNRRLEW